MTEGRVWVQAAYVHWVERREIDRILRALGAQDVRFLRPGWVEARIAVGGQAAFYQAVADRPLDAAIKDGLTLFRARPE